MKPYTWPELFKVVNNPANDLSDFIKGFPEKYHDLVGLALSVAHWHPSNHEHLFATCRIYSSTCGLCAVHVKNGVCNKKCPLIRAGHDCSTRGSKWKSVRQELHEGTEESFDRAATVMYVQLKRLYVKEYKHCLKLKKK